MERYSQEFNEAVIASYNSGVFVSDIYKEFNLDSRRLTKIIQRTNTPRRPKPAKSVWRRYSFNFDFFKNPPEWTEKQAYFLGWLYSDGYNNTHLGSIHIKLQEKDKYILEALKKQIGYTGPLTLTNPRPCIVGDKPMMLNVQKQWKLSIANKILSKELDILGVNKGKSKDNGFPTFLRQDLYPHFLRGLWDGDGGFSGNLTKYNSYLYVNSQLSSDIQKILKNGPNVNAHIADAGCKNVVRLCINGNRQVLRLANYLYSDSNLFLIRKFLKVDELIKRQLIINSPSQAEFVKQTAINLSNSLINCSSTLGLTILPNEKTNLISQ